jgi:SAM-dependent methyltransferase
MGERMAAARAALDIETGGGEVLATVARPPGLLVATESWPPAVAAGRDRLHPLGAHLVAVADAPTLPFVTGAFDLVVSRHPVVVLWDEIARVLKPGGTYLSQQIGADTNRELREFLMGPQPVNQSRSPERTRTAAEDAGLEVLGLRSCALRVEFFDVGAVVHFLRKVHWTVPGFTPQGYRGRLRALHVRSRGTACSPVPRSGCSSKPAGRTDCASAAGAVSWPDSPNSCCSRGCAAAA